MAVGVKKTVVGVFETHDQARRAVAGLRQAGFRDDQIGLIAKNVGTARNVGAEKATADAASEENYAGEGAATGIAAGAGLGALWGIGIIAGVMPVLGPAIAGGALAAILTSAAAGAAAAGLAGALVGMGIPKEEAEYYQSEFHAGRVLVTVSADARGQEAENILRGCGGHDITSRRQESTHSAIGRTPDMGRHSAAAGAAVAPGGQLSLQSHSEHVHVHIPQASQHTTLAVPVPAPPQPEPVRAQVAPARSFYPAESQQPRPNLAPNPLSRAYTPDRRSRPGWTTRYVWRPSGIILGSVSLVLLGMAASLAMEALLERTGKSALRYARRRSRERSLNGRICR